MNCKAVASHITDWLAAYCEQCGAKGFIIGISGGIDSALCSTLAARTGKPVMCVALPILQAAAQVDRAHEHISWLKSRYPNVRSVDADLTVPYQALVDILAPEPPLPATFELSCANTRSRLRMTALYFYAGLYGLLVVGTGNKVEDFGIGFFTKYGDGGVDLSPIAGLTKTQVRELSIYLDVVQSIVQAKPTDGLFGDDRSDEDQIGASYPELERAMQAYERQEDISGFSDREKQVYAIFVKRHQANRHKMDPIPCCAVPPDLLEQTDCKDK